MGKVFGCPKNILTGSWCPCWGMGFSSSLLLESRKIPDVRWRSQCSAPDVRNNSSSEQIPFSRVFLGKIPSHHWRSPCSSPTARNNPSLEKIPFSRVFPGKIPSQFPHPPLEIPMFSSGLFITTPGWSKFPFPGFSGGKFLVDPSGICWKRSTSSLLFLLLESCIHIHVLEKFWE